MICLLLFYVALYCLTYLYEVPELQKWFLVGNILSYDIVLIFEVRGTDGALLSFLLYSYVAAEPLLFYYQTLGFGALRSWDPE